MSLARQAFKIIRALYRENSPTQLALGLIMGIWLASTPTFTLHGWIWLSLLFIVRLNFAVLTAAFLLFTPIFLLLTPVSDSLGQVILLKAPVIRPVLAGLFHAPIFPYTHFYNSVVMGNFLISLVLTPILFFSAKIWIDRNHTRFSQQARDTKIWKRWIASRLYRRNMR